MARIRQGTTMGRAMLLRVVGAAAIVLGICIIAFGVCEIHSSKQLAAVFGSSGNWHLPVTHDEFLFRSKLWAAVVILSGLLTGGAGLAIAYGRQWGWVVELTAALLLLAFAPASRLLFSRKNSFEGPDLLELAIASVIGLCASLTFVFRAR